MTVFKRRVGDFQSSAKAICGCNALHFDPTKQNPHERSDAMQKIAKKAQKFIDKAINSHQATKIFNRAYIEDDPYNDIVSHLNYSGANKCR